MRLRIFDAVLPVAPQQVPIPRVARLELCGSLVSVQCLGIGVMSCARGPHAKVGKIRRRDERDAHQRTTRRGARKGHYHAPVLCLALFKLASANYFSKTIK